MIADAQMELACLELEFFALTSMFSVLGSSDPDRCNLSDLGIPDFDRSLDEACLRFRFLLSA